MTYDEMFEKFVSYKEFLNAMLSISLKQKENPNSIKMLPIQSKQ